MESCGTLESEMSNRYLEIDEEIFLTNNRFTAFRTPKYDNLSIVQHVKYILKTDAGFNSSMEDMAKNFFLTPRTFTRRLAKENTSYRQVQESVRMEIAADYLISSTDLVADVSKLMGYNNASNFIKAFKRWSGSTPSRYRSALRKTNNGKADTN